jgi:hypothetical protein
MLIQHVYFAMHCIPTSLSCSMLIARVTISNYLAIGFG